jgi:hypothetical protein
MRFGRQNLGPAIGHPIKAVSEIVADIVATFFEVFGFRRRRIIGLDFHYLGNIAWIGVQNVEFRHIRILAGWNSSGTA